jgi:hypothetical protein
MERLRDFFHRGFRAEGASRGWQFAMNASRCEQVDKGVRRHPPRAMATLTSPPRAVAEFTPVGHERVTLRQHFAARRFRHSRRLIRSPRRHAQSAMMGRPDLML